MSDTKPKTKLKSLIIILSKQKIEKLYFTVQNLHIGNSNEKAGT